MRVIVSECLLGVACRYDGGSKPCAAVRDLCRKVDAAGVCPERAAGLPVPREPAEQLGGRVWLRDGTDVTEEFGRGAQACLAQALRAGAPLAVLKAKSPSCGSGVIYDGTYTGRLVAGDGVFARLLEEEGICVVTEDIVEKCKPSVEHPVAIVLGTGLGHLATLVKPVRRIDYHDIDGFPREARPVPGHSFEATIGTIDGVPVVVYPGRPHLYQGYSAPEVTSLVRHAHELGCRDILFSCATGYIAGNAHEGLPHGQEPAGRVGRDPRPGEPVRGHVRRIQPVPAHPCARRRRRPRHHGGGGRVRGFARAELRDARGGRDAQDDGRLVRGHGSSWRRRSA